MSRIYWDSMLFIYALEGNPSFFPMVDKILGVMERRGDTLCTSVFCIGEVLVGPRRLGSHCGADRVKSFFASGSVEVLPFTLETADHFGLIRAWTGARSGDAIHLATAALAGVDVFQTNDRKLQQLRVPGISVIAGLDPGMLTRLLP